VGRVAGIAFAFVAIGCGSETTSEPPADRSPDALATALTSQQAPEYYVEQANKYFDTLDASADPNSVPEHSVRVADGSCLPGCGLPDTSVRR